MNIAIKGNLTRGKEIIQLLENLGGINKWRQSGKCSDCAYYIDGVDNIYCFEIRGYHGDKKIYTLEEFEKEFPFKVGDIVKDSSDDEVGTILGFIDIDGELMYVVDFEKSGHANMPVEELKPYKEMKEERNITLTLDKAKEWYKKGGELKEIALQAFSEKELNPLPKSWEAYTQQNPHREGYVLTHLGDIAETTMIGLQGGENLCPSQKSAEAHLAMIQLEQLRNCWWNGWEPEWSNGEKYIIKWYKNDLMVLTAKNIHAFLVFPTREMAEEFLECFRDLIEKAGDLI